jgi:hypothetical protein
VTNAEALSRVVVLLTAAVFFLLLASAVQAGPGEPPGTYVVRPGDTLWAVGSHLAGPEDDVRRLVHEIRRLNDLQGSELSPGEVLLTP